jgi:hypothetical protein
MAILKDFRLIYCILKLYCTVYSYCVLKDCILVNCILELYCAAYLYVYCGLSSSTDLTPFRATELILY